MYSLCVFAGTQEGHRLISLIQGRGAAVTACVATEYGREMLDGCLDTRVLTGRLTEEEMEALFRREAFDLVVDATHPYADQATENIASACEATHTPYLRLQRDSERGEADGVCVPDTAACVEYLKTTEGPILLTTGSKELPLFCADEGLKARIYARVLPMMSSLKICEEAGLKSDHIIAMQGPFDEDMNLSTLRAVRASWLVTKDTGSAGGYEAKIRAAKRYGARCVIIGRPPQREGRTLEQVIDDLKELLRMRHIQRMKEGKCGIDAGFIWADLLTDLERCSDHCSNIAGSMIEAEAHARNNHATLRFQREQSEYFSTRYLQLQKKYGLV